jgi:hypothetical protein
MGQKMRGTKYVGFCNVAQSSQYERKEKLTFHVHKCFLDAICLHFDILLNETYSSTATPTLVIVPINYHPLLRAHIYLMHKHHTFLRCE